MKEITRIHIAKTAYDIEPAAKKAIETYINALERYADDPELLADIEIRITELLAEHGVEAGGVITSEDVAAVRAQLGEPTEFIPEGAGDIAVGADELADTTRHMYRDIDSALLGGVLAGMARYFGIDPVWTRLIFLVLLVISFGAALIVYLILWLIVPPARTAAEKLRMNGQPVTLSSIKALGEQATGGSESARIVRRILVTGAGVLLVLAALGALLATVSVTGGLAYGLHDNAVTQKLADTWWLLPAVGLFVLAGLLFTALCSVLAAAVFRRRWTKRFGVAVVAIIAAGLLAFAGGMATAWYGSWQDNVRLNELRKTTRSTLPANFSEVKALTISGDNESRAFVNVEYVVDSKPRYELESLPGVTPHIKLSEDGRTATVAVKLGSTKLPRWGSAQATLKIYGPALDSIEVGDGTVHYYNPAEQQALTVTATSGSFSLAGSFKTVRAAVKDAASLTLRDATIEHLDAQMASGTVTAGVVRTLSVRQPDACPARSEYDGQNHLAIQAVAEGKITYNGTERTAMTIKNNCGAIIIGDDDTYERWED